MQARGSVLLVDDEERLVKNLARALAGAGLEVTATTSPRACAALASVGTALTSPAWPASFKNSRRVHDVCASNIACFNGQTY